VTVNCYTAQIFITSNKLNYLSITIKKGNRQINKKPNKFLLLRKINQRKGINAKKT